MKQKSLIKTDKDIQTLLKRLLLGFIIVVVGALFGYMTRTLKVTETNPTCVSPAQRDCLQSLDVEIVDVQSAASFDTSRHDLKPRDQAMNLTVRFPDQSLKRVFVPDGERQALAAQTAHIQTLNGEIVTVKVPGEELQFTNRGPTSPITLISIGVAFLGAMLFINSSFQIRTYRSIKNKGEVPAGIPTFRATVLGSFAVVAAGMFAAFLWSVFLPMDEGFVWLIGPLVVVLIGMALFDKYATRKIVG